MGAGSRRVSTGNEIVLISQSHPGRIVTTAAAADAGLN